MLNKVYKNKNCILENVEQQFCNVAVRKQVEGYRKLSLSGKFL